MPIQTAIDSISNSQGSPFGFKNRIINGGMVIDQRNAGSSVTANGALPVDRFRIYVSQSSKLTAQQNLNSITPPAGFTNYVGISSSSAYSVTSSDFFLFGQVIEGYNMADLAWGTSTAKPITISFWARSSLTGTFGGYVKNGNSNRTYPFTYTINQANTWEKETITIPGDRTGTWLTTNGQGLLLFFTLGSGSSVSYTAGSWQAVDGYGATGATSVVGTNAATWYIAGLQVENGTQATEFDCRPYTTELQLCQRYYARMPITGTYTLEAYQGATGFVRSMLAYTPLPVVMRTTPNRLVITTGSFTNIRGSSTTYAGLAPQSPSHCSAFLETNNATGMSGYAGAADAFDAEL